MKIAVPIVLVALSLAACASAPVVTDSPRPTDPPTPGLTASPTLSPTAAATPAVSPTASPTAGGYAGSDWIATALGLEPVGATFVFHCPPGGFPGVVWGSDVYTADSSVCTAAVHAGVIDLASGGDVTIEMRPGQESYEGSARNGVTTVSYGSYDASFSIVGAPVPTESPSPSVTAPATSSPATGLVELFSDDFSDPTSGFAEGENEAGTAAYGAGTYEITPAQSGAYIWTRRLLEGGPYQVLRLNGTITPNGEGLGGLLCGGGGDNHLAGVVVATDDRWFAIEIVPGAPGVNVLDQGVLPDTAMVSPSTTLAVTGECAITDAGLELILSAGDPALPIVAYRGEGGPSAFDRVALYGESLADGFSVSFDDVTVSAGQLGGGLVNLLLEHIPTAYRPSCQETPPSAAEPGALVAVACFRQQSGAGAEIVEYVQFDSAQSMEEAYAQRLEHWFTQEEADTCQEGASESPWTIGGESAGEVFCAPQTAGIRMDWTDTRLNILTSASEFEGSYPDVYQTWQEAGPEL